MILSFNHQFVQPIMLGTKIHTIRLDSHNRWQAGNTIQMATGVRTKKYNCFAETTCVSTQKIKIEYLPFYNNELDLHPAVIVDDMYLSTIQVHNLAIQDGFKNIIDFFAWFDADFEGKIIHWTDFKF